MKHNSNTWKHDALIVQKSLPFIRSITSCSWTSGVVKDRSKGMVPGPSSVFLRGYAVVGIEDFDRLRAKYKWVEPADVKAAELEVAPGDNHLSGPVLASTEMIRALPTESTYHQGRLYLLPDSKAIYFDLTKD